MTASKNKLKIDVQLVKLFVETWNDMTATGEDEPLLYHQINWGWCYQLALVIQSVYGGKLMSPGEYHAWVRIDGLDYDSENLHGADIGKRYGWIGEVRAWSKKDFKECWNRIGNSGPVRMDVVKATVAKYKKNNSSDAEKVA